MKDLYIPKGKTLRCESLACRDIVNDGMLAVEKGIQARRISGKGIVNAGSLSCRSLSAMDIEAGAITTGTLAAERVCAAEVKASGPMVVSCCLEAAYVETPSLTVAVSQVVRHPPGGAGGLCPPHLDGAETSYPGGRGL